MGTKGTAAEQDTINIDSDCEIQDADLSSITIPDSCSTPPNTSQSDWNNGKEIFDSDKEALLFEVNFKSSDVYNEMRNLILSGLTQAFKDYPDISFVEDGEAIQAFRQPADEDMGISGLFMIDTQPAEKVDAVEIPSYKRTIKEVLDNSPTKKTKKSEDECLRPRHAKSCFNCGGQDHDLRNCPKPRNNSKINRAKKKLALKHERYHVDIEQRFAHLRPGKITKNLRDALGIRSGELPFFFYRMRVLGYPPGWLEDAKVAHSGISLFDSEGRSVRDPEGEDGEIDVERHKYDVNKIIAFPGYNADPGANFFDDHKYHNVPPLNPDHYREEFIKLLGDNVVKGYKRKKLKDLPEGEIIDKAEIDLNDVDMEIEDHNLVTEVQFTRPPPPPVAPKEPSPPPLPPNSPPQPPAERSPSPSLADLEARQKKLLQELHSNVPISDNDDSLIDDVLQLESDCMVELKTPVKTDLVLQLPRDTDKDDSHTANGSDASPMTPQTPVVESVLGTPLLKFSPFDKLPSGDNFKVGVSDVINFENLPDSTGTYEKMKDVIKKVRTIVTQLNSEDT